MQKIKYKSQIWNIDFDKIIIKFDFTIKLFNIDLYESKDTLFDEKFKICFF